MLRIRDRRRHSREAASDELRPPEHVTEACVLAQNSLALHAAYSIKNVGSHRGDLGILNTMGSVVTHFPTHIPSIIQLTRVLESSDPLNANSIQLYLP